MESSLTALLTVLPLCLTLTGKTVRATDVSQERDDRRLVPLQHLQGGVATGAAFQRREVEQHTRALYYYYYLALLLTYLWRAVKMRRPHPLPLPQCAECLRHVRLRVRLRLGHRVRVGLRVGLGLVSGSGEG